MLNNESLKAFEELREQLAQADKDVTMYGAGFIMFTKDGCKHVPYPDVLIAAYKNNDEPGFWDRYVEDKK